MANVVSEKKVMLTYEGLEKLENELDYLKTTKRKEVSEKIKQALSFGDLSENSEYDEAKNEQGQVENMLKNAKVIDDDEIDINVVSLGSRVEVLDMEFDEKCVYTIVGSTEADPSKQKISDESPVGKALIGHKVDDVVDAEVPSGVIQFKILAITKA